ncbi:MAG: TonB family protein [Acidobacteriota bacterium]|nr:TonB family protein [Acidobacteriota bacterium]
MPDEKARGVEAYKRGDFEAAIKMLSAATKKQKEDADAWYYLGLALNRKNDVKRARKAFERAVKLRPDFAAARSAFAYILLLSNKLSDAKREAESALSLNPQNADAHFVIGVVSLRLGSFKEAVEAIESALQREPQLPTAYLIRSQALLGATAESYSVKRQRDKPLSKEQQKENRIAQAKQYKAAAESLEKYLQLNPQPDSAEFWREQLETLRVYAKYADEPEGERSLFSAADDIIKAVLLSKPTPSYTESARQADVSGEIILRVVLASDGAVKHILVVQSLSHGLTEKAVAAARKIKFTPATKNGQPVSQYVTIAYNFNIY